ncbi:MAG: hypothetical protein AAFY99_13410 [Pseudomonadota bacterium]
MAETQGQFRFLKVYGERNTGTNFVEQLVLNNMPNLVALSRRPPLDLKTEPKKFPRSIRFIVQQRIADLRRRQEIKEHINWKHAYVIVDEQRRFAHFDETFFIFIVRNPYYFISSLYRRAYDIIPKPARTKARFLRQAILLNARDNINSTATVSGPAELWSLKTQSYVKAAAEIENAVLIRYEDLVAAPDRFVVRLAEKGLALPDDYEVPRQSTKGDRLTFDDYATKAKNYDPTHDFSKQLLKYIDEQLDQRLLKDLGYERSR